MVWIAGVDGCKAGWIAAVRDTENPDDITLEVHQHIESLFAGDRQIAMAAVDMPIGLADRAVKGGRAADRAARAFLSPNRTSSVFSCPARPAFRHLDDYKAASAANRDSDTAGVGLSKQSFAIMPKIKELDDWMTPAKESYIREAHPEVSFKAMNGGAPLAHPKKTPEGKAERGKLLIDYDLRQFKTLTSTYTAGIVRSDDVLDSLACLWTAERLLKGEALSLPESPERDSRGLVMAIWY